MVSKEELSRLQKNARNKLYRLRTKGVVNATLSERFGGVLPMSEVNKLGKWEKEEYAKALAVFNSRKTVVDTSGIEGASYVQSDFTALPYERYQVFQELKSQTNSAISTFKEDLLATQQAAFDKLEDFDAYEQLQDITAVSTVEDLETAFPNLRERERSTPFTVETLEKAIGGLEQTLSKFEAYSDADHIDNWRESVANRVEENGYSGLSSAIRELSATQLNYLHYFTDFTELSETFRYIQEMKEGYVGSYFDELSQEADQLSQIVMTVAKTVE